MTRVRYRTTATIPTTGDVDGGVRNTPSEYSTTTRTGQFGSRVVLTDLPNNNIDMGALSLPDMSKRRSLIIIGMFVLPLVMFPIGTVTAQECTLETAELESLVDVYNQNVDTVPGIVRGQLSDQRIDLRIDTADGERRFAVTTDADARITQLDETVANDPTLRVETDESTLCDITTNEDPTAAFAQAYEDGSIKLSGVGIVNSVKVGAVKVVASVVKFLSGVF